MKVILLERITGLGAPGDLVTVKSGYGRNFLLPGKKAIPANKENMEKFLKKFNQLYSFYCFLQQKCSLSPKYFLKLYSKDFNYCKKLGSLGHEEMVLI